MIDMGTFPDLKTKSPQQRNVVLHPEFVEWKICFLYKAAG